LTLGLAFNAGLGPAAMRADNGRIDDPNRKTNVPPFQGGTYLSILSAQQGLSTCPQLPIPSQKRPV
jgi:hypothetical protein